MKDVMKELVADAKWSDIVYAFAVVGSMYIVCELVSAFFVWAGVA